MAKSVIQHGKECYVCKTTYNLHDHHIFFGSANRKWSEKFGMKIWLCQEHHTGNAGIHFNKDLDNYVKRIAQERFEALYGANTSFREVFGKNYL